MNIVYPRRHGIYTARRHRNVQGYLRRPHRASFCSANSLRKDPSPESRVRRVQSNQNPEFGEHGVWLQLVEGSPTEASSSTATSSRKGVQTGRTTSGQPAGYGRKPLGFRPAKWTPFTQRGRDDLQSLVSSLQHLKVKNMDREAGVDDIAVPFQSTKRLSELLPESPVVRRLRHARQHKLRPAKTAEDLLAHNPWAQMLASPLRMCSATGMRVPRALLTPWALTQNPVDGQTYLMPSQLANLERLRRGVKEKIVMGGIHEVEDAPNNETGEASEEHTKPTVPAAQETKSIEVLPRHLPKIYLLPMSALLQHLSARFSIRHTYPPQTVRGTVSRLLSFRMRAALEEANRHAKAAHASKVKCSPLTITESPAIVNPRDLQWDHGMLFRMRHILQERVIAAFEGFLNRNKSSRNRKRIKIFSPDDLLDLERLPPHKPPERLFYLFGFTEASHSANPSHTHGPTDDESLLRLRGSIVLALTPCGPSSNQTNSSTSHVSQHPLLPQTVNVYQTLPIPIFHLPNLLDQEGADRVAAMMQGHEIFEQVRDQANTKREPEETKVIGHTILIPSQNPAARILVNEVWRLWRYSGGV